MTEQSKDDVIETAKKRFQYAVERASHNRDKARADLRFLAASPDDPWQWEDRDIQARRTAGRPMLTINKLPQHVRQVTNDIRQNRPSIKYRPADSKADVKVADILMGIVRHIEANSDADVAYDAASEHQVIHGTGYVRVLADYVNETSFDQEIFIAQIDDPFKCWDDPDAVDPAGADRKWFFIETFIDEDEFKKQYPDAEQIEWQFQNKTDWFTSDKKLRLAEYLEVCHRAKELYLWPDGSTSFKGDPLPPGVFIGQKPEKTRKVQQPYVMWRKMNGQEVLEEKEFPSKYIPVSRAWGNHYVVDGKVYVSGIVRNAKDSQRMYNVSQSAIVERVMMAPKAQWVGAVEAFEGYETHWRTANTGNHAFLPYNYLSDDGTKEIPAPQRIAPTPIETGLVQIAAGSADDIKAETGQYDASLGQRSNETSGKAIMARQREGDMATYHYVDNLARMVRHVGRIVLDMIPRIYDTERIVRILGENGEPSNARLDPTMGEPLQEVKDDQGAIQQIFNPSVGTYDVYTTTGPSYTTRRQEAVEAMTQMTQANPELWAVIGDLLVKNMDWPGAEEMAERLRAVLRPEVKQAEETDEEIPPQLRAVMEQMQQQMQAMQQSGAQLQQENEDLKTKKDLEFKKLLIEAYKAETDRLQAVGQAMTPEQVQAIVLQTFQQVLAAPQPSDVLGVPHGEPDGDEMAPHPGEAMEAPPDTLQNESEPPQGGFFTPGEGEAVTPAAMPATGA